MKITNTFEAELDVRGFRRFQVETHQFDQAGPSTQVWAWTPDKAAADTYVSAAVGLPTANRRISICVGNVTLFVSPDVAHRLQSQLGSALQDLYFVENGPDTPDSSHRTWPILDDGGLTFGEE